MSKKNLLPATTEVMQEPNFLQLLRQGAMLHYSTINSCLRISKSFRLAHGDKWIKAAFDRFIKECGMNVALFFMLCILSLQHFSDNLPLALAISFIMPPLLSATQVAVDYIRPDGLAYFDPQTKAGLSVKLRNLADGTQGWQFYNHFAFPVGYQRGHNIRHELHHQAIEKFVNLSCSPQNTDIRTYYTNEHPHSRDEDHLMVWNYQKPSAVN